MEENDPIEAWHEVHIIHEEIREAIETRLDEFRQVWERRDPEELFYELLFCIFTPQSKATSCWSAVEKVRDGDLLMEEGAKECVAEEIGDIGGVRFHHTKAERAVIIHDRFMSPGGMDIARALRKASPGLKPKVLRDWLVDEINGIGMKEAGHFLRNIGLGIDLAILDRHILRNLVAMGALHDLPGTLTRKRYIEIEDIMENLSEHLDIPMGHLDLILWYKEAGEIFK